MVGYEIKNDAVDSLGFMDKLFYIQIPYASARALTKTDVVARV